MPVNVDDKGTTETIQIKSHQGLEKKPVSCADMYSADKNRASISMPVEPLAPCP